MLRNLDWLWLMMYLANLILLWCDASRRLLPGPNLPPSAHSSASSRFHSSGHSSTLSVDVVFSQPIFGVLGYPLPLPHQFSLPPLPRLLPGSIHRVIPRVFFSSLFISSSPTVFQWNTRLFALMRISSFEVAYILHSFVTWCSWRSGRSWRSWREWHLLTQHSKCKRSKNEMYPTIYCQVWTHSRKSLDYAVQISQFDSTWPGTLFRKHQSCSNL